MKLLKTASGKTTVKMSRSEWEDMGKKAGWMREAAGQMTDNEIAMVNFINSKARAGDEQKQRAIQEVSTWTVNPSTGQPITDQEKQNVAAQFGGAV